MDYFTKNNTINKSQNGFLPNKDTNLAIFETINEILTKLNEQLEVTAMCLDLSKAFDCVNHGLLINKLSNYGIRGSALQWCKSYLTERQQKVQIDDNMSDGKLSQYGVPQGSVLGPLFFIIYVNDFAAAVDTKCIQYADDTTLIFKNDSVISHCFNNLIRWFSDNMLKLNLQKTQLIKFSGHKTNDNPTITINNNTFDFQPTIKFLGVTVDSYLSWKSHIDCLRKKLNSSIYMLRNLVKVVDSKTALTVYYSHIYAQLRYGIVMWGNSVNVDTIFKLQKYCIRIIFELGPRDSCLEYFKNYNILTVPSIYILESSLLIKKHPEHYTPVSEIHMYNTRNKQNMIRPCTNKGYIENNVYNMSVKIYNSVPNEIKMLPYQKFKNSLKKFLIQNAYYDVKNFIN